MSIFQKTVKLVLATSIALFLAYQLGLSYAGSAGVIALLSVLDTRRSSLRVAFERLLASLLALALASLMFTSLGFGLPAMSAFLLLYLPLSFFWQLDKGIAPSTVLVLHLLQEEQVTLSLLGNELALFAIGTGLGLLVNLYMPSKQALVRTYRQAVEEKLRAIMRRFEHFLLSGDGSNEGLLIGELDQLVAQALTLVYRERHNQLFQQTNYDVHYFEMRQAQGRLLRQMAELVNCLNEQSAEGVILAQLFSETAQQISETNSGRALLQDIDDFLVAFRGRELPQTRSAFENRAILFQLLQQMRLFIQLKLDFYQQYGEEL